ncbi:hypothetical protein CF651_25525 [Paenibacillus rigui]|uniref:NAD-dependent epimerase/dehydratase domain-containing protein n=2 Tax=Paenibacillus rigui TaxID=554312 RepID=A0A229UJM7_9BACL|nr:hypothetical protein CF651_25525 [Paenibacillus rigui]
MNPRRIVITGAAGFTGRHACAHFAALGYDVVAVVRRPGSLQPPDGAAGIRVTEAVCSLDHADEVEQLLADTRPQELLHLAGLGAVAESWREPMTFVETNVMGTLRLLDALRRLGADDCRVVVAGSMLGAAALSSARPSLPPHPYGLSKAAQVLLARWWGALFGLPVMIGQPSNLIGPGHSAGICGLLADRIARAEAGLGEPEFRLSSATEARDFVDVRDAVRAYELILRRGTPGVVYGIGTGYSRTLGEVASRMLERTAVPFRLTVGEAADAPQTRVDLQATRALGWQPAIPFRKSIDDILAYYRNEIGKGVR